ncbi:hypothetical protein [Streptomyces sp. C10-9-1]|uniref:hypothetical protein n=1 Tax=Streptomyces sp. C10-9-1 TaxID=1859285 RepID=UPI003D72257E
MAPGRAAAHRWPDLPGVDLARRALLAAREAAKKNGAAWQKLKRRTGTVVRRDGSEPLEFGTAIVLIDADLLLAPAGLVPSMSWRS